MPRISYNSSTRHKFLLPVSTLERIQARAITDETPTAELIRRIIDLAVTFEVPTPTTRIPPPRAEPPTPFSMFMPQCMLDELRWTAQIRNITPEEVIRRAAIVYLHQRAKIRPPHDAPAAA